MEISGNVVAITGGATGIGFALAQRFASLGNRVLICGRRDYKLREAAARLPRVSSLRCDISKSDDREALCKAASDLGVNVLVNNAGIQRSIDMKMGLDSMLEGEDEIETNLRAQVRLTASFIPLLMERESPEIVNVSSGLAIVPLARFPLYCATKAAMHSFSMSLRQQLSSTKIKVFELLPPTVHDTELKGKPVEKGEWSLSVAEVADAAIAAIASDKYEIPMGSIARWMEASREEREEIFNDMNR